MKLYNTAFIIDGQIYGLGIADELNVAFNELLKEKNVLHSYLLHKRVMKLKKCFMVAKM